MKVLGIHGGRQFLDESNPTGWSYHDAAAVLIDNGEIAAAIEEERLTRMKHCNCFPVNAISFCLSSTHTRWDEIDRIAINQSFGGMDVVDKVGYLENPRRNVPPGAENHLAELFRRSFGVDMRGRFRFCQHHLAHAWSAFIPSGFERALVVSLDGDGDNSSGMVLTANGLSMEKLKEFSVEQSLGNLYTSLIKLIGYSRFDEYKVMGLAPYGDPDVFAPVFEKCYQLLPDGEYEIGSMPFWLRACDESGILAQARRKGSPFSQEHCDLAASIQQMLENIVFHVLKHYKEATGEDNLCLAGGVAHNCTLNGKVLRSALFDQVFVQPAAHDAGGALGAAWWSYYTEQSDQSRPRMTHLYYGTEIADEDEIAAQLERWSGFIQFRKSSNIAVECAALLAGDAVIGWIQGRSEFGPRALGNRSILADPRPARNKERINEMIKKREGYRPFAPSVREEKLPTYFDVPRNCTALPFMIFVVPVREEYRNHVAAVTHLDGTARVHSVSEQANPTYWELIREFERITGTGMLLNTSFNNNAEPIVDSVDDAVGAFLTTGLSYLAIGPYLISRRPQSEQKSALLKMVPDVPAWHALVKRKQVHSTGEATPIFRIESIKSKEFGNTAVPISNFMFVLLQEANGKASVLELLQRSALAGSEFEGIVLDEILDLWTRRAVILNPPATPTLNQKLTKVLIHVADEKVLI